MTQLTPGLGKGLTATYQKPSGFRDVDAHESVVTILGFVWGRSLNVGRYSDNREECAIAVCADENGKMTQIPVANLTISRANGEQS